MRLPKGHSMTEDINAPRDPDPPASGPTIDALHRDLALANGYRMELAKTVLAISAALFAFTVTFAPSLKSIDWKWALWVGWFGLAVSMLGGLVHLLGWDHFYKSYHDVDWSLRKKKSPEEIKELGKKVRGRINAWRRCGMVAQFGGFLLGVAGVGVFAGKNIENTSAAHGEAAPTACCCGSMPPAAKSAIEHATVSILRASVEESGPAGARQ